MIRVTDLEKSIHFYTEILGMKLLRRQDYPEGRFTLAFVAIFFSLRVCVSRFTLAFDDDQKLCKMDFQRVVQDGVQVCKSRCRARW